MPISIEIIQSDPTVPLGVFGEQLRTWQVPFRVHRPDRGEPLPARADAVIILGGTMGVHDEALHPFLRSLKDFLHRMLAGGTPLFGVCLGAQLLAEVAGGTVSSNCCGEKGLVDIRLTDDGRVDLLFAGCNRQLRMFQWHNDSFSIPPGAQHLATSATCTPQAFRIGNAWGVQFHPEVDLNIVSAWSRKTSHQALLTADFAKAESLHQLQAQMILANFLAIAGHVSATAR